MANVQWQAATSAMEIQAKEDEEKKKLKYKSVTQLYEVHQIYESFVDESTKDPETPPKERMAVFDRHIIPPIVEAEGKIATSLLLPSAPLKKLDLSGLLLVDVPDSIGKLSMLAELDLSNNNLKLLPECLTSLANLTSLDVHSNQLVSLPDSIGQLVKLKILNVSSNSLAAFPDSIENCRSLEEVSADFNEITILPDSLGFELVNLKKLSVHSNRMSYLPSSTAHMTSLRVLDVHLNKLTGFPEDIGSLVNLEYLNVSSNFNNFVGLPESIGGLRSLMEMDVSYNQIRRLPSSIGGMEKLHRLAVEGNPLVEPPPKIVEHGVEAVKQYMKGTANGGRKRRGASSWLGHMIAGALSIRSSRPTWTSQKMVTWHEPRPEEEEKRGGLSLTMGFLSPCRLFSPRHPSSALRGHWTPQRTPRGELQSPLHVYSRLRSFA